MVQCEKCKAGMPWVYGPTTSLVGGVVATLCAQCRTEWNKFAIAHPIFQRLREIECVRNSIAYSGRLSADLPDLELGWVLKEMRECEAILHEEGLKWIGRED